MILRTNHRLRHTIACLCRCQKTAKLLLARAFTFALRALSFTLAFAKALALTVSFASTIVFAEAKRAIERAILTSMELGTTKGAAVSSASAVLVMGTHVVHCFEPDI